VRPGHAAQDNHAHHRYRGTSITRNSLPLGLCLGPYGGPRGVGVSYERGTPVCSLRSETAERVPITVPAIPRLGGSLMFGEQFAATQSRDGSATSVVAGETGGVTGYVSPSEPSDKKASAGYSSSSLLLSSLELSDTQVYGP